MMRSLAPKTDPAPRRSARRQLLFGEKSSQIIVAKPPNAEPAVGYPARRFGQA